MRHGALSIAWRSFETTTTLKRSEFGLGNYVPQVSDKVQVRITT